MLFRSEDESVLEVQPTAYTAATSASPVGTYPINLNPGSDNNYTLTYTPGTLNIVPFVSCTLTTPNPLPLCGLTGNILASTSTAADAWSWSVSSSNGSWALTGGQLTNAVTYTAGSSGVSGTFTLTVTNTTYNISSQCSLTVASRCEEYCT